MTLKGRLAFFGVFSVLRTRVLGEFFLMHVIHITGKHSIVFYATFSSVEVSHREQSE
jgi:hypothetical protein